MQELGPILTICSHDPGSHNYGIAVVRVRLPVIEKGINRRLVLLDQLPFSVVHVGKLTNSLTTLKETKRAEEEVRAYSEEIRSIVEKYQPDVHIAERYMSRRMGGVTIELVNMILGSLRTLAGEDGVPIKLIPASQWKNELKRRDVDLKEVYKAARGNGKRTTPHEVDAVCIALYGAFLIMRLKPFNVKSPQKLALAVLNKLSGGKD